MKKKGTDPRLVVILCLVVGAVGGYMLFLKGAMSAHSQAATAVQTARLKASVSPSSVADALTARATNRALSASANPPQLQAAIASEATHYDVKVKSASFDSTSQQTVVSATGTPVHLTQLVAQLSINATLVNVGGKAQLRSTGSYYSVSGFTMAPAAGGPYAAHFVLATVVGTPTK